MTKKVVKFKKLVPEAILPSYAHDGDIGMDVFAVSVEYDRNNDAYIYHTGLACETVGHMGILGMMKSSIYKRRGHLTNAVGLIDSDQYRGEILFIYKPQEPIYLLSRHIAEKDWDRKSWWYRLTHNKGQFILNKSIVFENTRIMEYAPYEVGEAVGQLVPLTFDCVEIQEVNELSSTERGEGGFGSTDKKKSTKKSTKPRKVSKKV